MPNPAIQIDFSNVRTSAIGPVHGLAAAEIRAAQLAVKPLVTAIEAERRRGEHAYRALPEDKAMLRAVEAAARGHLDAENLVVLGIGGSALGNIALQTALNSPFHNLHPAARRRGPRLFVMDNVDPVQFSDLLTLLGPGLRRTLFNVISKSGETAETAAQFLIVRDLLLRKLGRKALSRQVLVTTDPEKGTFRALIAQDGYEELPVPPGVGGRFSVLSAVGLFSAALCGIDVRRLLAGAVAMSVRVGDRRVARNPAAMLALVLHAFYARGKRLHVMMPYSFQLKDLADWYRQLWAESLGKSHDLSGRPVVVGPTPIRALGATDQHSQVQLYREGPNDKVFMFLECGRLTADVKIPRGTGVPGELRYLQGASLGGLLNAEKLATECALVASQRPCLTIRFPTIDEHTVGQFIMLWEAATTIMGRLLNVNPYDQPAVQLGKEYTFALLAKPGFEKQGRAIARHAKSRAGPVV